MYFQFFTHAAEESAKEKSRSVSDHFNFTVHQIIRIFYRRQQKRTIKEEHVKFHCIQFNLLSFLNEQAN